jgi:UDP-N-acetylmuramoylalanine--D-glutamate ligase
MQNMAQQQSIHQQHNYLVVGLGLTGYATARYLLQRGYSCQLQDDRQQPPYLDRLKSEFPTAEVMLQPLDDSLIEKFDCWVVSPGVSIRAPVIQRAIEQGVRIVGDVELYAEAVKAPVIAITGSNGKSTVTTLVGEMARLDGMAVGVGGNIGTPVLDLLEQEHDLQVIELSSFQLESTSSLRPLAASVLNVSEDHMDRYRDFEDYCQSKHRIYRGAQHCISNADDENSRHADDDVQFSVIRKDCQYHLDAEQGRVQLIVEGEAWIDADEVRLKGRHNLANCLAAIALARQAGISQQAILQGLRSFPGLPHRSQWVAEINGVTWINDSKATNPGAAKAAIEGLDQPIILLAGGQGKGANMQILCETVRKHLCCMLVFGQDSGLIESSLAGCCAIERLDNLEDAVGRAYAIAQPGDVVMLSPACASFDQFSGFAQRGERFMQLVEALE